MKKKEKVFYGLGVIVVTILIVVVYHFSFGKPEIKFVRTGVLIQEYNGMIRANDLFSKEMTKVQSNIDTLRKVYEFYAQQANQGNSSADLKNKLSKAEEDYYKYNQYAMKGAEERKQEIMKPILEEINMYIQEYGKEKGYDLILGSTTDGSLLYGKEGLDITEDITKSLNKVYAEKHGNTNELKK